MLTKLHRLSAARILLVDDDIVSRHVISASLNAAGFRNIETADDGQDALDKTYSHKPDLVILDLNMPKLDGFGYCEHVRNNNDLPRMPILVQTMMQEREAKLRALSCGADDFLHKPLDLDELNLRVCGHLERYFMAQEMRDMCSYLLMELDCVEMLMHNIDPAAASASTMKLLKRHCEAMETMIILPCMARS